MPGQYTYPGVYVEEVPSGVRTITGVATSITAFVGRARMGPLNEPVRIQSFGDFERIFGGLWGESPMTYAVQQFFANGGGDALVVRLVNKKDAKFSEINLPMEGGQEAATSSADNPIEGAPNAATAVCRFAILQAKSPGTWSHHLRVIVDHATREEDPKLFNLTIRRIDPITGLPQAEESFLNLSTNVSSPRHAVSVLKQESQYLSFKVLPGRPVANSKEDPDYKPHTLGEDGDVLKDEDYMGNESEKSGLYALEKADLFNLLCIPPPDRDSDISKSVWGEALGVCRKRRAILLIDPPRKWKKVDDAEKGMTSSQRPFDLDKNAAVYWPFLQVSDPLKDNRPGEFAPSGAVAGVIARTDRERGIWKAPAGLDATLASVQGLTVKMTDAENGSLNPLGLNCLRSLPLVGPVVWGARTSVGADRLASEWKYLPVRRMALYIEESLYRGMQWVVFEPNDERLWSQIRLNAGAFMQGLFRDGAFQGSIPQKAYFVKCDAETNPQDRINLGIVTVKVGFAPLKPAEFVVIQLQQMAGQIPG
jgi:phage tail sheath protein FI